MKLPPDVDETYVILPSRPGQYRTEAVGELVPTETWEYIYCGRHIATYVIAALYGSARLRITDESETPPAVNLMPTRFLERFSSRDAALAALRVLTNSGNPDIELRKR